MLPALALGLASFLANFDVTAVVVALPAIARDLNLGVAGYAWMMDAYSLAFTSCLLIAGALADRHGRRRAMLGGNIAFAIASVCCALAWDGWSLGLARSAQGLAAAFIVTGGISLIASIYADPAARTRAFSWLGVITGISMALGPTVGGVVSSWLGWRWVFWANIPICVLVAWGVPRLVAEVREPSARPLDVTGMVLLTAALGVLIEALLNGRSAVGHMVLGVAVAAALLMAFVVQQKRRAQPIFDPSVFLRPAMVAIAVLLCAVSTGYWAVLVYLPPFFKAAFGWTAEIIGAVLLAATLPMLILPPFGGWLAQRLGWRLHFAVALAIIACGDMALAASLHLSSAHPPLLQVIGSLVCIGIGAALAHPQLSGAVVALVPTEQAGMASGVTIVMRQGGFSVGIAVLGALLADNGTASAYVLVFAAGAVASVIGAVMALVLLPYRRNAE